MDCPSGKVRHATERAALATLADLIRMSMTGERPATIHGETSVYSCHLCWGWHLTSKPKRNEINQGIACP